MIIHRAGSRPSTVPNPDYFTGTVRMDPLISAPAPARLNAISVTFEPGARTAWHSSFRANLGCNCWSGSRAARRPSN